ncbi:DUF262 domain-containing protein [Pseudocitrobacter vendiensis]|uniref:DUF262 domain-containing protein n=1 Tax=Pseudocitrobacter vendiensis TaxID=2488306 RepID=A0ABN8TIC3_9ENTR|nr:DUF262 domain-containing protein [Pseudocitrobacter vendiensis]CAH6670593.1 DUF262 domain-containing protein [Pseudocitrobacter vendiensis]
MKDDFFQNDDFDEEIPDNFSKAEEFSDLIVAPSDWTVETIYRQMQNNMDINPEFQRRSVWNQDYKSRFIESVFLGVPIPQVLLSSKKDNKNSFLVLDGKQRLLTIKEFIDGRLEDGKVFKLRKLRVLKDLEGKTWQEIEKDFSLSSLFLNQTLRTAVIRNWKSEETLYEIFYRLNSGSVKLSPMELRMSLHPGKFLSNVITWSEKQKNVQAMLGKNNVDSRMNDVEIIIRYIGFRHSEIPYKGNLKDFLDKVCIKYNEICDDDDGFIDNELKNIYEGFSKSIDKGMEVFGNDFCRKFTNGSYDSRFNRAVFDVLSYVLGHDEALKAVDKDEQGLKLAYEEACSFPEFIKSVESSTKNIEPTKHRFGIFIDCFNRRFNTKIDIPEVIA